MTDRLQRFELKIFVCVLLKKQSHLHLGCPAGADKHQISIFGLTIPLNTLPLGILDKLEAVQTLQ